CADFGSTFTKLTVVDLDTGELVGTAGHRTTIESDVMDGYAAAEAMLAAALPRADLAANVLACSSAGGGLRLAVVGYERAVTAEAGHRVGLSAGAKVVHVAAGQLERAGLTALVDAKPDVVLLAGGTDGGNAEVLLANAATLAGTAALTGPIVVAGNVDVRDQVEARLRTAGKRTIATANVLPRIGELDPAPARAAIREVFIRHVIGGKGLSRGTRFAGLVRAATPDAVLAGVELLADGAGAVGGIGDVVVVDIGGATTDVYSVLTPDAEESQLRREVVEESWRGRTVEGDLGMRWNASGIVEAALAERLLTADSPDAAELAGAATVRVRDPGYLPESAADEAVDARLAELAATVALRRHARPHVVPLSAEPGRTDSVRRGGKDLREVGLVVGSGGVLRHAHAGRARQVIGSALADRAGGWKAPEHAAVTVDRHYVLAAAGLLSFDHPETAAKLLLHSLGGAVRAVDN
ncbi:MAG: glutamate mutase L, partial [Sporichthyaceae bacterium]|nr:glutamate mutase L [Sporichthyaceae bacterium]